MRKLADTFIAVDEDGRQYTIHHYINARESTHFNSPTDYSQGLDEYECGSSAVTNIGGDVFHIARLDTKVKKVG